MRQRAKTGAALRLSDDNVITTLGGTRPPDIAMDPPNVLVTLDSVRRVSPTCPIAAAIALPAS
jgi:hypothetical protein